MTSPDLQEDHHKKSEPRNQDPGDTMKILLVLSLLSTAAAFVSPPAFFRTHNVALKATAAEQHLEQLLEEWNQLEYLLDELNRKDDRNDDVRCSLGVKIDCLPFAHDYSFIVDGCCRSR